MKTSALAEDRVEELLSLHRRVFGDNVVRIPSEQKSGLSTPDVEALNLNRSSRRRLNSLLSGKSRRYKSDSEADFAACCALVEGGMTDEAHVDAVIRSSALMRPKWDERRGDCTYGERTIKKALTAVRQGQEDKQLESAALVQQLNQEFAVVTAGSSVVILREIRDAEGSPDIVLLKERAFRLLLLNWPKLDGDNASKHWLANPQRREYDGLVFDPSGKSPENFYNLFRGFSTTPKSGACHLYLRFVRDVICAGDAELGSYVINWMAHLIQRPEELPEVALVLRSGQGTGKNTLVTPLARILGQMFYECTNMERLTGKFNNHLKDKLLVHANEATWGGNKSAEGTLKAMITDSFRAVEPKGKDIITVRNCSRLIISSNEKWPVACGPDDRRFVFLDVSEVHKQDHAYFKAVYDELDSGGVEALHDHFLKVDIDGWHPRQRPKPRYGADVKIRSLDLVGQWWNEVLETGVVTGSVNGLSISQYPWGTEPNVSTDMIVAAIETFARKQPRREWVHDRGALFKRLNKLCPGITKTRPTDRYNHGTRSHCYVFPPLDECRRSFEKAINCEGLIDWSDAENNDN